MANFQGAIRVPPTDGIDFFDFQIFDGVRWVSLNDHLNFIVGGDSFKGANQARRRFVVQSSMYDGDWEVHSVASSVNEVVVIDILGQDSVMLAENILLIQELLTQPVYTARKITDDIVETWRCFPAEWAMDTGQFQTHANRAQMRASVPRFPKVTYEVQT